MDIKKINKGLDPVASIPERLQAFTELGLPNHVLAESLNVAEHTVANWKNSDTRPQRRSMRAIDDIRFTMLSLISIGLPHDKTADLMQKRFIKPPHQMFIEFVVQEPDEAIEMVSTLETQ